MGQFDANEEAKHCQDALKAAKTLIKYLCHERKLIEEHTIYGLRQVRPYAAPSDELYGIIKKWDRWVRSFVYYNVGREVTLIIHILL